MQPPTILTASKCIIALRLSIAVLASLVLIFPTPALHAQDNPDFTDNRPGAPLMGSSIDSVSLANNSLLLHIPLWSIKQRGNLKLDFGLKYDKPSYTRTYTPCTSGVPIDPSSNVAGVQPNSVYQPRCTYPDCTDDCTDVWDITPADPDEAIYPWTTQRDVQVTASTDVGIVVVNQYTGARQLTGSFLEIITPDGGAHVLVQTQYGGSEWRVTDGTGWRWSGSSCTLFNSEGTRYVFACPTSGYQHLLYEEDTNGNRITLNYRTFEDNGTNYQLISWTDSMGRIIPAVPRGGTLTTNSNCPTNTPYSATWQVPGAQQPFVFCYSTVAIRTNLFQGRGWPDNVSQQNIREAVIGEVVVSAIIKPTGEQWGFRYLPLPGDDLYGTPYNYGELREVTLPTGGSIRYRWETTGPTCGVSEFFSTSLMWSREIRTDANSVPAIWSYGYGALSYQVGGATVLDPLGNVTQHIFDTSTGAYLYGLTPCHLATEIATNYYDHANTLIKSERTDYQALHFNGNPYVEPSFPITKYIDYPDGTTSKITFQYGWTYSAAVGGVNGGQNPTDIPLGNVTAQQRYDFSGNLVSTLQTTYEGQTSPLFLSQNMLNRVATTTLTDPSAGPPRITQFGYDESFLAIGNEPPLAPNGIPVWNSSPPNGLDRGNPTSITRVSVETGTRLTTKRTYTNTGLVRSVTMPAEANISGAEVSIFDYSPTYFGGYLTSHTNALGQTTLATYYADNDALASLTDPNGNTTNYTLDGSGRLTKVLYPASVSGGQGEIDYNYVNPTQIEKQVKQDASTWITIDSYYDGLGQPIDQLTQGACDGGGSVHVKTTYDLNGNVSSMTNPYCLVTDKNYGVTSFSYDALNRKTMQCNPDNGNGTACVTGASYQQWQYLSEIVKYKDEAYNIWTRTYDGLGRLQSVLEPGGFLTSYTYTGFDELKTVNQSGLTTNTARTRSFLYNSLGQLIASLNPESGSSLSCPGIISGSWSLCYFYDNDGNLRSKGDARGVIVSYSYDALNRLIGKAYTGTNDVASQIALSTPSSSYVYDTASGASNAIGHLVSEATGSLSTPFTLRNVFQYDARGHVLQDSGFFRSNGVPYATHYSYDLAGNTIGSDNGVGTISWTPTYDSVGRLLSVGSLSAWPDPQFPTNLFNATGYGPAGIMNWTLGLPLTPALKFIKSYDSRLRVSGESVTLP